MLKPYDQVTKKQKLLIIAGWAVLAFILFEVLHSPIIPSPTKVGRALIGLLSDKEFYEDLIKSLLFTFKAMGMAILATALLVYSSVIPIFSPIADFVSKLRYLTLTGLVFLFTVMTNNIGEVKMALLLMGIIPFFTTSFLSIIRETPEQEVQKGYVNGKGRWGTLLEVTIIGRLNMLLEVMRQNFAISWMMITMVEGYAMNEGGVGTLIIKSNRVSNFAEIYATLIVVLILGLSFDWGLSFLRRKLFPFLNQSK